MKQKAFRSESKRERKEGAFGGGGVPTVQLAKRASLDDSFGPTRPFGELDGSFGPTRPFGELDGSNSPNRRVGWFARYNLSFDGPLMRSYCNILICFTLRTMFHKTLSSLILRKLFSENVVELLIL